MLLVCDINRLTETSSFLIFPYKMGHLLDFDDFKSPNCYYICLPDNFSKMSEIDFAILLGFSKMFHSTRNGKHYTSEKISNNE